MNAPTTKGFQVSDGNEILKSDIPAVAELIARTARWVHPETFRALPVWAPPAARGQPLFDPGWSRRSMNTRKATGIMSEKFEGNVAAAHALFAALDVSSSRDRRTGRSATSGAATTRISSSTLASSATDATSHASRTWSGFRRRLRDSGATQTDRAMSASPYLQEGGLMSSLCRCRKARILTRSTRSLQSIR
jgi:hypothetical protein